MNNVYLCVPNYTVCIIITQVYTLYICQQTVLYLIMFTSLWIATHLNVDYEAAVATL